MRLRAAASLLAFLSGLALASCGGEASQPAGESGTTAPGATAPAPSSPETAAPTTTAPEAPAAGEADGKTPRRRVVLVRVRGGVPQGGIVRASVRQGDTVVLRVRADVADEVHVHGYDLYGDVAPGREVRLAFRAAIPGRFEIELEGRHVQIAELTVRS